MWERAELKRRAKEVLKGSYWKAFLVSIVMGMVSGGSSSFSSGSSSDIAESIISPSSMGHPLTNSGGFFGFLIIMAVIMLVIFAITIAVKVLIGYHLEVGGTRYFVQGSQGDVDMGYLGYGFKSGRYVGIIKTMFWKDLMVFLWTLLLIIPGIIKQYAYTMVPYILADNPEIGHKRALELSDQMTKGHKFDIFILHLSFIGWYLLGILACVVGVIFVAPYQHATQAELYLVLREQAIDNGACNPQELNLEKKLKAIE